CPPSVQPRLHRRVTLRQRAARRACADSFDHLVGAYKDCFGNGDPYGSCSLEVYDHLEPSWALDGGVGWLGAAQNPSDVTAATAKHIGKVWPIRNKTSGVHVRPVQVYRG